MIPPRPAKKWQTRGLPEKISSEQCRQLALQLHLPLPIITLLCQRGLAEVQEIESFLRPALNHLPSPFSMKDMDKAASIVAKAIVARSPITIYGDYDVDGVTGTAVLLLFLRQLGAEVGCYHPDRLQEGYGLNSNAIKTICQRHASRQDRGVLITVDCGIADVEEVDEAKAAGLRVIVTDHHKPPLRLPAADAILNPLQPGCGFPFKHLAGAGVTFYLAMGIRSHMHAEGHWRAGQEAPNLKAFLDLVALGTVADMVPLHGPNRILVKAGLEVMEKRSRPGLARLMELAGVPAGSTPSAEDIAFRLGPRINALGRIGRADNAVRLLTTEDALLAAGLADELERANELRKSCQQQLFAEATIQAAVQMQQDRWTLVLNGPGWHTGVLGIVAAKITESFMRPTILLSLNDGRGRGSGRSIPGLDLYEALTACTDLLEQYGGHEGAAGLTIAKKNLAAFVERFEQVVSKRLQPEDLVPRLTIDCQTSLRQLCDSSFLEHYDLLSPFGIGNPEPVFLCPDTALNNPRVVGASHLRCSVRADLVSMPGIGFGLGHLLSRIAGRPLDLAVSLRHNNFKGETHWELNLVDIKIR